MEVIIAGGGIGGLTAALCLARAGIGVTVYEAASELRPLGLGINVQAGAIRVLSELGLEPALAASAIETRELIYMNRHGQTIWSDPRGRFAGLPWPQFSIHRGELQLILHRAAVQALGPDRVRIGHRLVDFVEADGRVTAQFAGPDGAPATSATGDALIGADGIHSRVRAKFHPEEGPPKWNGVMMWRGTTRGKKFLTGASMIWAGSARQKFVCYPISRPHADRGEALINWICDLSFDDRTLPRREDWNRPGRLEDFLPRFEGWQLPFLNVPDMLRAADTIHEFPMVDRDPLTGWSHGRVSLLGDAAHPMYPIGSNGASQAIFDAEALAQELSGGDVVTALGRYAARRLPVTARITESNRRQGIDVMLDIVEQRAPDGFDDLEAVLPAAELNAIVADYKKLASQDRETLLLQAGRTG